MSDFVIYRKVITSSVSVHDIDSIALGVRDILDWFILCSTLGTSTNSISVKIKNDVDCKQH